MSGVLVRAINAFAAIFLLIIIISVNAVGSDASGGLAGYKPVHAVGSGMSDWWITYPPHSSGSGTLIAHPKWVLDSLKEKPVLILYHTTTCTSCVEQKANIENALADYSKDTTYYDLLDENRDKRALEAFHVYSLTGLYVPVTTFITLAKGPDGKVSVAWHTSEDTMSEEDIASYLKDAIYYYQQNAPDWSK